MARPARVLEKKDSSLVFREISPPHGWKEDPQFHYLRLTLPGFEAKDITIHMNKYGHLVVRGNKQVTEHKYISFEETFEIPNDADLEEADGFLEENQIYCVTIPKKKKGPTSGHAISMAQDENNYRPKPVDNKFSPIHQVDTKPKPQRLPNNPIQVITGHKFKKRIAFFIALLLIALLVVAVVLIVKLRHH